MTATEIEARIPAALGEDLQRLVGFRNILVRGYEVVDLDIVLDVPKNHLGDLLSFVEAVRRKLGSP